jgi:hypothetical protein
VYDYSNPIEDWILTAPECFAQQLLRNAESNDQLSAKALKAAHRAAELVYWDYMADVFQTNAGVKWT